jgi:DNA-binding transcriptional MerR regulator
MERHAGEAAEPDRTDKASDAEARPSSDGSRTKEEALYNIGAVARMTGVPVATIRAWERRYGFPKAERTNGGHRIYTESEVTRLRWVKGRVDEGMQPSKAVHALEVTIDQGRFPEPPTAIGPGAYQARTDTTLDRFQARLTGSLLEQDLESAGQILADVVALYGVEELILGVLRPALADIGAGWSSGQVSVATEHLASQLIRERLMRWMPAGPAVYHGPSVVLACAPDEWHDLSLLMFGVLLSRRRWPLSYLGQSVPLPDLAEFVGSTKPRAVVLVAMHESSAEGLRRWPDHMPRVASTGIPPVCIGGRVFTEQPVWRKRVPGIFLGSTLEEGIDTLEAVLREVQRHPILSGDRS